MKKVVISLLAICCCAVLFACQKPCEHQYQESITTEASCTDVGVKTFTCSLCQDSYTEQIAATGHSFGREYYTKAATCVQEGEKTHSCTKCGVVEVVETLAKINHRYSQKISTAPTCVAEGIKTYSCTVCGDSYTEVIEKISHSYTSNITVAATCTASGIKTYTCSGCKDFYTETIARVDHSYTSKVTTVATCTEAGVKTYTCSGCGKSYTESISATGHKWADATCTTAKCCKVCNKVDGAALGHTTNDGKCGRCGKQIENEAKKKALVEENKRHETQISIINTGTDSQIRINESTIDRLSQQYGIGYVGYSESYYLQKAASLEAELSRMRNRLAYMQADTSGMYALEIMRLERQIKETENEYIMYRYCAYIAELKEKNSDLEAERKRLINQENSLHSANLKKIEEQYGSGS